MIVTYFANATRDEGLARGYCAEGIFAADVRPTAEGDALVVTVTRGHGGPISEARVVPVANVVSIRAV